MPKCIHGDASCKNGIAPEYCCWASIKTRCNNSNFRGFKYWGGKGIKVCPEWNNDYQQFLKDMGRRPKGNYSIDRIDNNKGYCKGNCRWILRKEQSRNRSTSVILNGETATEASKRLGGCRHLIQRRMKNGWLIEKAFSTPSNIQGSHFTRKSL